MVNREEAEGLLTTCFKHPDRGLQLIYKSEGTTKENMEKAYQAGLLPKSALENGKYYYGICRNSRVSKWDNERQLFTYMRTKLGCLFPEDIKHPEDDDGYDFFMPIAEIEPLPEEKITASRKV